jgi:hypothetical protein
VHWVGQSGSTVLYLANGANTHVLDFDSDTLLPFCVIRDLGIYGNRAGQAAASHGIIARRNVSDIKLQNIFIHNMRDDGIRFDTADPAMPTRLWNIWLENVLVEDIINGDGLHFISTGATLGAGADDVVLGVHLDHSYLRGGRNCLRVEGLGSYDFFVHDCEVKHAKEDGMYLSSVRNMVITGNKIDANGQSAANTYDGIYITDDAVNQSRGIVIANNLIGNVENEIRAAWPSTQRYGVNLQGLADYVSILGNNFRGNLTGPVYIAPGANLNGNIGHNIGY